MTFIRPLFLIILFFLYPTVLPLAQEIVTEDATTITTTPAHRLDENNKRRGSWWKDRHEEKLALAQQGDWELVFLGDSITHGWERNGKTTWDKYYGARKAINLGFGGDRTEHVLWRLNHGELDGYKPRVVVIMIGTNNTGHDMHPPEAIAAGIKKIIATIQKKSPDTKILLLGIFPRGATTDDPKRVNNDKTNDIISTMADEKSVFFLNINDEFLTEDGVLTKEIMPDLLHPKEKGYAIWAEAIEPTLARLYDMK
ncbi:MAG: platelet-activating factor acetylhydrolase IB subunit [Pirellulales bacterium]